MRFYPGSRPLGMFKAFQLSSCHTSELLWMALNALRWCVVGMNEGQMRMRVKAHMDA